VAEEMKGLRKTMWKPNQPGNSSMTPSSPEPIRPQTPVSTTPEPTQPRPTASASSSSTGEQATIGKSLVIKGEISGSETLYIDGQVEGSVNMPGNRVLVGRNGNVAANIAAREVVVLGKVHGNINASDRVDIRSEGALTGDVVAQRISIEDGAYFKGGIDIRKPSGSQTKEPEKAHTSTSTAVVATTA
jgi:cytoskeletal protein CcmA (bactofilin family)